MKTLKTSVVAVLWLCAACATAPKKDDAPVQEAPDESFRAEKPSPLDMRANFEAPVPQPLKLKNGARVLVVKNSSLPLVSILVSVRTGVNAEPVAKAGLSGFTAEMLDEGTSTRSSLEIAAALEDLAAEYSAQSGPQSSQFHMNCLSETLPQCLELLSDLVMRPAFRPSDFERVRGLKLSALARKLGSAPALASDEISRLLFGEKHPWGQPDGGTPKTIRAIQRADLRKFHDTWYRPNNATLIVVGDVDPASLLPRLEKQFGAWKSKPLPALKLPRLPETKNMISLIDKPGASQSQVWVTGRLFPATHPDAIAFRLGNYVLGGLFTSRLNMNLRETHGYSYGIRSYLNLRKDTGQFVAAGSIISKNTADALAEYKKEFVGFAESGATEDELSRAKEALVRSLPSILETNDSVALAMAHLEDVGHPLNYYQALPEKLAAITLEDVQRVSRKYIKPNEWPAVVVGPKAEVKQPLEQVNWGPLTERSVTSEAAQAQAQAKPPEEQASAPE
jgi:zinc protease